MNDNFRTEPSGTDALRALANALDSLQIARKATTQGFADDYCVNAIDQIKKAIAVEADALTGEQTDE